MPPAPLGWYFSCHFHDSLLDGGGELGVCVGLLYSWFLPWFCGGGLVQPGGGQRVDVVLWGGSMLWVGRRHSGLMQPNMGTVWVLTHRTYLGCFLALAGVPQIAWDVLLHLSGP